MLHYVQRLPTYVVGVLLSAEQTAYSQFIQTFKLKTTLMRAVKKNLNSKGLGYKTKTIGH